jgi:competence protein ComEA
VLPLHCAFFHTPDAIRSSSTVEGKSERNATDEADDAAMENIKIWWNELHYTTNQKRSLATVAILVLATSTFFIVKTSSPSEAIVAPLTVDVALSEITIDVEGEVENPGVYRLPTGARVFEAIKAAGGVTANADASDLNQARLLSDGEQIYLFAKSPQSSNKKAPTKVKPKGSSIVLLNRATAKEFEALDGIGPVLASRIVAYRKVNGSFAAIEDLLKVPGIGAGTLSKFKSKLRV